MRRVENGNFDELGKKTEKPLKAKVLKKEDGKLIFVVSNPAKTSAIGLKFNLLDPESSRIILPAYFSDGYFTLLPGEKRQMEVEWNSLYCNKVKVVVEGYNSKQQFLFDNK